MKKILSVIILLITLSLLLSVPVYADSSLKISEDYKCVYYQGKTYEKTDGKAYPINYRKMTSVKNSMIHLTAEQSDEIEIISARKSDLVIELDISFYSGGYVSHTYVESSYASEYRALVEGNAEKVFFIVQDFKLDNINVNTTMEALCGSEKTLDNFEVDKYDWYTVYGTDNKEIFQCDYGRILIDLREGRYFYLDSHRDQPDPDKVTLWVITDEELIEALDATFFGSEENEESDTPFILGFIVVMFLFIIFIGIPMVGTVLGFIFSARSNSPYKLLWRILALLFILCLVLILSIVLITIFG